jgi:predicted nucleotidyltransferase
MNRPYSSKIKQSLYIETARQKVIEVLFRYPEKEFSLSDLAKEAGVAKANIGRIINEFLKNGLIEVEKLSKIWRIKANVKDARFRTEKIFYNLDIIYSSFFIEYLNEYFGNPKAIILFGSFRRGEDISTSDIDIAIETDAANEYKTARIKELEGFEKQINRRIQFHLFNRKNVDLNVFNNIANGIVLSGFLEVKP